MAEDLLQKTKTGFIQQVHETINKYINEYNALPDEEKQRMDMETDATVEAHMLKVLEGQKRCARRDYSLVFEG